MIKAFFSNPVFTTERLRIRKLEANDLKAFHIMQSDMEVMKYAAGRTFSLQENKADIEQLISKYQDPQNTFWIWAIENEDHLFIGTLALIIDKEDHWEIGYRLLREQWGNGYATESVKGLVELVRSIDTINNLIAYADLRNPASQNVLTKIGFVNLGIKYNDTEDCEEYIYSINTND